MTLSDLIGERVLTFVPRLDARHPFDTSANGAVFGLDDIVLLVFDDADDGYRSSAGPLLTFSGNAYQLGFHPDYIREPVLCSHATTCEYGGSADVLEVRSKETGKLVFRIGTDDTDDYYPSFVVQWSPENLSANSQSRIAGE